MSTELKKLWQKAEERLERGGLPSEVEEARVSLEKARLRKKIADRHQQRGSRPTL